MLEEWYIIHKSTGTPVKWGFTSEKKAQRWIDKTSVGREEYGEEYEIERER